MTTSHREFMLLGAVGADGLAYGLSHIASPLKLLNLRLNNIGNQGLINLCSALANSGHPQELILAGCGFTDETGIELGQMLQQNTSLQALDISNNSLGEVYS
jgi:hypothetical protein